MSRNPIKKRTLLPDPKFNDQLVTRFVNNMMYDGKKSVAFRIFYEAMDIVEQRKEDAEKSAIDIWKEALTNVMPHVEVRSRRVGGATLTKLLGTSAWYAPGAAVSSMVQSILCDQKKMFPCSLLLEGEYGQNDICLGVPAIIGKNGVEKIVDITLTDDEKEKFNTAAEAVRKVNAELKL